MGGVLLVTGDGIGEMAEGPRAFLGDRALGWLVGACFLLAGMVAAGAAVGALSIVMVLRGFFLELILEARILTCSKVAVKVLLEVGLEFEW